MTRWLRLAVLTVTLLLFGTLAGGCRKVVSDVLLENVIHGVYLETTGANIAITCPTNRTMRKDNDFFCTTKAYGRTGTVLVMQRDDWGRMEFSQDPPLDPTIPQTRVHAWLLRQYGVDAKVTCPKRVIRQPDRNFRCRYEHHGNKYVRVRQVDGVLDFDFGLPDGQRA